MSKTIRMEEEDSNKITIPTLSIDEEGEEVIVDLNEAAGSEDFDDLSPSPEQVARLDEAFRGIKEIVGHKFSNPRKFKSDLLLNILWDDEKAPIWTSWNKSLGEEETAHKYLNSN